MERQREKRSLTAVLLVLALCLGLLAGCGGKPAQEEAPASETEPTPPAEAPTQNETQEPAEQPEADAPTTEAPDTLSDVLPMTFTFSSGAGAWRTALTLNQDGSFAGQYLDSEMGGTGDGYPNGNAYICTFSGQFGDFRQVDDHTWAMTLSELTAQETPGEEWIEDEIRYIASSSYGLELGKDFLLYAPETPTEGLPEDFLIWCPVGTWRTPAL